MFTGVLGPSKAGVESRIGYFDETDGFYFCQTAQGPAVVKRSSSTNQTVYYRQSDWNGDKLNGTGKSGITLDLTKTQIFKIAFQFLGVGIVKFSLIIDGSEITIHEIYHANQLPTIYMSSPNLPIRYQIENLSSTSSASTMKQICCSASQSGSPDTDGKLFNIDSGASKSCIVGTWNPIISISLNELLNGVKYKGYYNINNTQMLSSNGKNASYKLILNGNLTGAAWQNVDANSSAMRYDRTATAISGGIVLHGGYVVANSLTIIDFSTYSHFVRTFYAKPVGTQDILTIAAQGIDFTSTISASMNWFESH